MAINTANELVKRCEEVAKNYKTLYVLGCFGSPMNTKNKDRYCNNQAYNKKASRTEKIKSASADTFGFDCVCLIKGLLWGWDGNTSKTYGGASYASNNVPDIGADQMIKKCKDVSTDFSNIQAGEAVWMEGHIGVYIGGGLAVECTPKWKDGVQITAVHNIGTKSGYNGRKWTKHGKLPYITYEKPVEEPVAEAKTVTQLAREVLKGKWGNGSERKRRLTEAGYDYTAVQKEVNRLCSSSKKSNETIAKEVIQGKWGNGSDRKKRLTEAGYDPVAIQKIVNQLLK